MLLVVVFRIRHDSTKHTIEYHTFTTSRSVAVCDGGRAVCVDFNGPHTSTLDNRLGFGTNLKPLAGKKVRVTWVRMPGSPYARSAIDVQAVD